MKYPFNVRIYAIIQNQGKVLVSDESYDNWHITKFPGGGLEFGEGTIDCIKRELWEELGIHINAVEHFYTTDFFQASAQNPKVQVISIYYQVKLENPNQIAVREKPFDFGLNSIKQCFRWIDISAIEANTLTLPVDQVVAMKLKSGYLE
jgi:ADP-ribose pyrophosphatase YjhB (NUDIX family)